MEHRRDRSVRTDVDIVEESTRSSAAAERARDA